MSSRARILGAARRSRDTLLLGTALQAATVIIVAVPAAAQPAPNARPSGGQVVAGQATIGNSGSTTTIDQSSQRAAINWQSFDVGSQQTVRFVQPNAQSMTLNNVLAANPSQIAGQIIANGKIVLVNQNGVIFYQGAQVNAAGLNVSAAGITTQNFMSGNMVFNQAPRPGAVISNAGNITIAQAGLASLVAPQVRNSGTITARLGTVILGGATTYQLDLYGDGLLALNVTGLVTKLQLGGQTVTALVTNSGAVVADGGTVVLSAAAVDGLIHTLVTSGGTLSAQTVGTQRGRILVQGVGGGIDIEGEVAATGTAPGSAGGTVVADASGTVTLGSAALLDVSGDGGGGVLAVGTTAARAVGGPSVQSTLTAQAVGIASGATLRANAGTRGNGGVITVIGSTTLTDAGLLQARGGSAGGNGGAVTLSSAGTLTAGGQIDTSGPAGGAGRILVQAPNVNIPSGTTIKTSNFGTANGNYVEVDATQNITLGSTPAGKAITIGTGYTSGLILDAGGTITLVANQTLDVTGAGSSAAIWFIAGTAVNFDAGSTTKSSAGVYFASNAATGPSIAEDSTAAIDAALIGVYEGQGTKPFTPTGAQFTSGPLTSLMLLGLSNAFSTLTSYTPADTLNIGAVSIIDANSLQIASSVVATGSFAVAAETGALDVAANITGSADIVLLGGNALTIDNGVNAGAHSLYLGLLAKGGAISGTGAVDAATLSIATQSSVLDSTWFSAAPLTPQAPASISLTGANDFDTFDTLPGASGALPLTLSGAATIKDTETLTIASSITAQSLSIDDSATLTVAPGVTLDGGTLLDIVTPTLDLAYDAKKNAAGKLMAAAPGGVIDIATDTLTLAGAASQVAQISAPTVQITTDTATAIDIGAASSAGTLGIAADALLFGLSNVATLTIGGAALSALNVTNDVDTIDVAATLDFTQAGADAVSLLSLLTTPGAPGGSLIQVGAAGGGNGQLINVGASGTLALQADQLTLFANGSGHALDAGTLAYTLADSGALTAGGSGNVTEADLAAMSAGTLLLGSLDGVHALDVTSLSIDGAISQFAALGLFSGGSIAEGTGGVIGSSSQAVTLFGLAGGDINLTAAGSGGHAANYIGTIGAAGLSSNGSIALSTDALAGLTIEGALQAKTLISLTTTGGAGADISEKGSGAIIAGTLAALSSAGIDLGTASFGTLATALADTFNGAQDAANGDINIKDTSALLVTGNVCAGACATLAGSTAPAGGVTLISAGALTVGSGSAAVTLTGTDVALTGDAGVTIGQGATVLAEGAANTSDPAISLNTSSGSGISLLGILRTQWTNDAANEYHGAIALSAGAGSITEGSAGAVQTGLLTAVAPGDVTLRDQGENVAGMLGASSAGGSFLLAVDNAAATPLTVGGQVSAGTTLTLITPSALLVGSNQATMLVAGAPSTQGTIILEAQSFSLAGTLQTNGGLAAFDLFPGGSTDKFSFAASNATLLTGDAETYVAANRLFLGWHGAGGSDLVADAQSNTGSLVIGSAFDAAGTPIGTLGLFSTGGIAELGGAIIGGSLTVVGNAGIGIGGAATAGATLDATANSFADLGEFITFGDFILNDTATSAGAAGLAITGPVTNRNVAAGAIAITEASLTGAAANVTVTGDVTNDNNVLAATDDAISLATLDGSIAQQSGTVMAQTGAIAWSANGGSISQANATLHAVAGNAVLTADDEISQQDDAIIQVAGLLTITADAATAVPTGFSQTGSSSIMAGTLRLLDGGAFVQGGATDAGSSIATTAGNLTIELSGPSADSQFTQYSGNAIAATLGSLAIGSDNGGLSFGGTLLAGQSALLYAGGGDVTETVNGATTGQIGASTLAVQSVTGSILLAGSNTVGTLLAGVDNVDFISVNRTIFSQAAGDLLFKDIESLTLAAGSGGETLVSAGGTIAFNITGSLTQTNTMLQSTDANLGAAIAAVSIQATGSIDQVSSIISAKSGQILVSASNGTLTQTSSTITNAVAGDTAGTLAISVLSNGAMTQTGSTIEAASGDVSLQSNTTILQSASKVLANQGNIDVDAGTSLTQTLASLISASNLVTITAGQLAPATNGLVQSGASTIEGAEIDILSAGAIMQGTQPGDTGSAIIATGDVVAFLNGADAAHGAFTQLAGNTVQSQTGTIAIATNQGGITIGGDLLAGSIAGAAYTPSATGAVLLAAAGDIAETGGVILAPTAAIDAGGAVVLQTANETLGGNETPPPVASENQIGRLLTTEDAALVTLASPYGNFTQTFVTKSSGAFGLNDDARAFNVNAAPDSADGALLIGEAGGAQGSIVIGGSLALALYGSLVQDNSAITAGGVSLVLTASGQAGQGGTVFSLVQQDASLLHSTGALTVIADGAIAQSGGSDILAATGLALTAGNRLDQSGSIIEAASGGVTITTKSLAGTVGLTQTASTIVADSGTLGVTSAGAVLQLGASALRGAEGVTILLDGATSAAGLFAQTQTDIVQSQTGTLALRSLSGGMDIGGTLLAGGITGGAFDAATAGTVLLRADAGSIAETAAGGFTPTGVILAGQLAVQAGGDVALTTQDGAGIAPLAQNQIGALLTAADGALILGTLVATGAGGSFALNDDAEAFMGRAGLTDATLYIGQAAGGIITAGNGVALNVVGGITEAASTALLAQGGDIAVTAQDGAGATNGSFAQQTGAAITAATGNITISADENIGQTAAMLAADAGGLTLTALHGSLTQAAGSSITAQGAINLTAGGDIGQSDSTIAAGGPVTTTAGGAIIQAGSSIRAATGNIVLTAAGAGTLGLQQTGSVIAAANGSVSITSEADVLQLGQSTITAAGDLKILLDGASGVLAQSASDTLQSQSGTLALRSERGDMDFAGTLLAGVTQAGGFVASSAGTVLLLADAGNIAATGDVLAATLAAQAAGNANFTGANQIGEVLAGTGAANPLGTAVVTGAGGRFVLDDNALAFAGRAGLADATLYVDAGTQGGSITAGGGMTFTVTGNFAENTGVTLDVGAAQATVTTTGALTQFTGAAMNAAAGTVTLQAGTGETLAGAVTAKTAQLTTAQGTLALSGSVNANSITMLSANGAIIWNGAAIETGGLANAPAAGVGVPLVDWPENTGNGLLAEARMFTILGTSTVAPLTGRAALAEIRLTSKAGAASFGASGLAAPNTVLLMNLDGGTASGFIDVRGLTAKTNQSGAFAGYSRQLFGLVDRFSGPFAASVSQTTGRPQQQLQINDCPLTSTNCVLLSPFVAPIYALVSSITLAGANTNQSDEDFQLPAVAREDY